MSEILFKNSNYPEIDFFFAKKLPEIGIFQNLTQKL